MATKKSKKRSTPGKPKQAEEQETTQREEVLCSHRPGCECPYCLYHGYIKGPRQTYD